MRVRSLLPLALAVSVALSPALAQEPAPAPPAGERPQTSGETPPAPPDQTRPPAQEQEAPRGPDPAQPAPRGRPDTGPEPAVPTAGRLSTAPSNEVPLDEIRRYVAVYTAVKQAYVEPVADAKLMHSAIRGLLLDLDPHSVYFDRADAENFAEQSRGNYHGIGVEIVRQPDGSLRVIAPIDGTPAARAGLKAGDLIIAVDGRTLGAGDDEESGSLRGEPGSEVVLSIVRDGRDEPFDVTVERGEIRIDSVRSRMLEPGYGYVRISAFQADTAANFERQLDKLIADAGGKLHGLVIDLRSNPGGLLTSAVQIADALLESGQIVSTRGRIALSDAQFGATPGDRLDGAPVVVLVDAGSASASEVLAGALRDNDRARVVGSRTFGKGSVQTLLPLDNGDSVKLTTARYYTPSGKSIQALGIIPDVILQPEADAENGGRAGITEAALPRHLRGDDEDLPGANAGAVLEGESHVAAALAELKKTVAAAPAPSPAG
ncbi:MAG: S41 family peptidase [Pseudomonadota bacterium]|nr:S41 family peptidase [Pseudomonadota bacterium]